MKKLMMLVVVVLCFGLPDDWFCQDPSYEGCTDQ